MDKQALEIAIDSYGKWLIFFGVLVAIGAVGGSWYGILNYMRSNQLQRIVKQENLDLQTQAADAQRAAADAQKQAAEANTHLADANVRAAGAEKQAADANTRAAEAQKGAADAQLALERYKAPRRLSPKQVAAITAAMHRYAGTEFTAGVYNDKEPIDLMIQISSALLAAGWKDARWQGGGDIVLNPAPNRAAIGYVVVEGLYVQADASQALRFEPIMQALAAELERDGLPTKVEFGNLPENDNKGAIRILVGKKPP